MKTGARVRNAYTTCLILEYSLGKLGVILHNIIESHDFIIKAQAVLDWCAYD